MNKKKKVATMIMLVTFSAIVLGAKLANQN
jgi:hypothetical protein